VEGVEVREHVGLQRVRARQIEPHAAVHESPRRVVALFLADAVGRAELAVRTVFAKAARLHEGARARGHTVIGLHVHVVKFHCGVVVDGAALSQSDDGEAVSVEGAALNGDPEIAPDLRAGIIELPAAAIAELRLELDRAARGTRGDDVDHAAHRVVAVQAGAWSIHDFNAIDALHWHTRPIHPAAEGVVHRDAVREHQCPADTARPDAAQ